MKLECDKLCGVFEKISFINNRIYDLEQWQLQYDIRETSYSFKFSEKYYPNFDEKCRIELKRLKIQMEIKKQHSDLMQPIIMPSTIGAVYKRDASDTDLLEVITACFH